MGFLRPFFQRFGKGEGVGQLGTLARWLGVGRVQYFRFYE